MLKVETHNILKSRFGNFIQVEHEGDFGTATMIVDIRTNKNKFRSVTSTAVAESDKILTSVIHLDSGYLAGIYAIANGDVEEKEGEIPVKASFKKSSKDIFESGVALANSN